MQPTTAFETTLIAPCGMDCALCVAHLRERNRCAGCNGDDPYKPRHCVQCSLRNCASQTGVQPYFCYECEKFPCRRLKQLDQRYRTKYGMSMHENLAYIRDHGLENFVEWEQARWTCPKCGGVICVHRGVCFSCGQARQD